MAGSIAIAVYKDDTGGIERVITLEDIQVKLLHIRHKETVRPAVHRLGRDKSAWESG